MSESAKDYLILTRKRRIYTQEGSNPKISVDKETYRKLQEIAVETDLSISSVARQLIAFAADRVKYADE